MRSRIVPRLLPVIVNRFVGEPLPQPPTAGFAM